MVADSGALAFRTRLPGGAPEQVAVASGMVIAALSSGSLAGIDPEGGILWKRQLRANAVISCGPQALVLGGGTLCCIEPESGKTLWERELAAVAEEATVHEGAIAVLSGGAVCTFSTRDGEPRQRADVRWARRLLAEDDGALIALGPGGAAMRLDGRKRWSIAAEGNAEPAAVLRRGILLLQRGASELYDVSDGILVAELPAAKHASLASDLSCALLEEDAVSLHRLTTHLSVV